MENNLNYKDQNFGQYETNMVKYLYLFSIKHKGPANDPTNGIKLGTTSLHATCTTYVSTTITIWRTTSIVWCTATPTICLVIATTNALWRIADAALTAGAEYCDPKCE